MAQAALLVLSLLETPCLVPPMLLLLQALRLPPPQEILDPPLVLLRPPPWQGSVWPPPKPLTGISQNPGDHSVEGPEEVNLGSAHGAHDQLVEVKHLVWSGFAPVAVPVTSYGGEKIAGPDRSALSRCCA